MTNQDSLLTACRCRINRLEWFRHVFFFFAKRQIKMGLVQPKKFGCGPIFEENSTFWKKRTENMFVQTELDLFG